MSINPVNKFDIVGGLPIEVGVKVLSYLINAKYLAVVTEVNKHWNQLSKIEDLKHQLDAKALGYKRVSFIDEAAWTTAKVDLAKNGLSFEGYCVNQCKLIKELQTCLAWPIEKINGVKLGVTVVTIPKGLSINKLQKLAPQLFGYIDPRIVEKYGDIEVSEAYKIIIADNVMEETRGKDPKTQVKEIEKYGGERPKAIEIITLLVLTYLNSEKRLYGKEAVVLNGENRELRTYTRCEEQIVENQGEEQVTSYQVVVGYFGSDGFSVDYIGYDNDFDGLAALRKF